jgi:phenylpropionate dioxygenase-like ring-hydroxylating dioxygenase large terminal subunit
MAQVESLLDTLAGLAATPFAQARPLPPELYHDEALFALEKERIFGRDWLCAGRAADIPNPGDHLTYRIADQPILVIRGEDGAIRSFSNVCLHRMMRLVEGTGNCRQIICPYHAWTYDLEGRLVGAAHMQRTPGFTAGELRLPEIRTEIWQGWIYVTLDRTAESVARRLAALEPLVADYRMADYVPMVTQDHVWRTNWKILSENFMEGYHLPVSHRRTVGAWFPANQTRFPEASHEGFTYQTFVKDETAIYGRAHPANTRLTGPWRYTSVMPTIFPTHMYVLAPDHLWYLSLQPLAIGEIGLRFGMALAPEVRAALADPAAYAAEMVAFFDRVNEEDRGIVEAIFETTRAPLARPARFSWLERELHDFMRYLAVRLAGGRRNSAAGALIAS